LKGGDRDVGLSFVAVESVFGEVEGECEAALIWRFPSGVELKAWFVGVVDVLGFIWQPQVPVFVAHRDAG
jgi:hypothetical protein